MFRRCIAIVAALAAWAVGGILLAGCAGFLFSAVMHPFATSGWVTSAWFVLGLGAPGALIVGTGCWLASRVWSPRRDATVIDDGLVHDDAMWCS